MAKPFSRRPLLSMWAKKRFSKPSGVGEAICGFTNPGDETICLVKDPLGGTVCGYSQCGDIELLSGIYQTHYCLAGKFPLRMKMYWPSNPRTFDQQTNRAKYTASVAAWKALSEPEREVWRKKFCRRGERGYDRFRSEYLLTH